MPEKEVEQFFEEEGDTVDFDPRGSRAKSQSGNSQVSGEWTVEKTQEMPKTEAEQFLREEGDMDREENGEALQQLLRHVRKDDVSGEFF